MGAYAYSCGEHVADEEAVLDLYRADHVGLHHHLRVSLGMAYHLRVGLEGLLLVLHLELQLFFFIGSQ